MFNLGSLSLVHYLRQVSQHYLMEVSTSRTILISIDKTGHKPGRELSVIVGSFFFFLIFL